MTDPAAGIQFIYRARVFRVARASGFLILVIVIPILGCTLLVDSQIRQCQSNAECARFGASICDPIQLLCVPAPDAGPAVAAQLPTDAGATASCRGTNGCYSCAPKTDQDFLNACTDGHCIPFDNKSRLGNLASDGTLRPLP